MNKSLIEKSFKEQARTLFNTPKFDLPAKMSHVTDIEVLKELKLMAEFQNRIEIRKLAEMRAKDIGLSI